MNNGIMKYSMFLEKLYQSNLIPKVNYFNNYIKKYYIYHENIYLVI